MIQINLLNTKKMCGIKELLNSPMGKTLINGIANQLGMNTKKAGSKIQSALPLILGAMKRRNYRFIGRTKQQKTQWRNS